MRTSQLGPVLASFPSTVGLRVATFALLAAVPMVLGKSGPLPLRVTVADDYGRPLEAVVVRVIRTGDPRHFVDIYTDGEGRASTQIWGVRKTIDLQINPPTERYEGVGYRCHADTSPGPTYDTERRCAVAGDDYATLPIAFTLRPRLPSRQICRLTGYGGRNGPYQYAGQDSAFFLLWVDTSNGTESERLLWWFGDTTDVAGGEISVPNKMAISNPQADASRCIDLEYVGPRGESPLQVDATVADEATVWLDLPLVAASTPDSRQHGRYAFRPQRGDRLHLGYLSVKSTPPLFEVMHLGLATLPHCEEDCFAGGDAAERILAREPAVVWSAPLEYGYAPEQNALLFDDRYVIIKVRERRTHCEAAIHQLDCSVSRPCPGAERCIEPGKFCDEEPHVACFEAAQCPSGNCVRGGVIAMEVERSRVADKAAYRYWDARSRTFEPRSEREPDAILVDATIGNSVSVMWSEYLERWIMISNEEVEGYRGQRSVALRQAADLLGPWSKPVTVMENLGGQRSYNPRFIPAYTRPGTANLVYWTATYDTYDEGWPMHGLPFDYNVFLYETDLRLLAQMESRAPAASSGNSNGSRGTTSQENRGSNALGLQAQALSSSPRLNAR